MVINMNEDEKRKKEIEQHKCKGCEWGTFTGIKYKCMFSNCIKEKESVVRM